ncbi:aspartate dehydrogenase [Taklimakanibacter deserti]|uniref:aspartate dehydrogenase n=1 Tax=Taklimakanibacter deserti TaxID=2267839 RepID=UPI000E64BEB7
MHVGLIGAGAIGKQVLAHLGHRPEDSVTLLMRRGKRLPDGIKISAVDGLAALLAHRPDIVVEAAGQQAVVELMEPILNNGIPVIICSTGALADGALFSRLIHCAKNARVALTIAGGAVAGLDYVRIAALMPDARIRYSSRKPVAAWRAELAACGHDPDSLSQPVALFEGSPSEGAKLYPRNLNAALTVALAASPAPVQVRVIADPAVSGNCHEIDVESRLGSAHMEFDNAPDPENPKTSLITAFSVIRLLEDHRQVMARAA